MIVMWMSMLLALAAPPAMNAASFGDEERSAAAVERGTEALERAATAWQRLSEVVVTESDRVHGASVSFEWTAHADGAWSWVDTRGVHVVWRDGTAFVWADSVPEGLAVVTCEGESASALRGAGLELPIGAACRTGEPVLACLSAQVLDGARVLGSRSADGTTVVLLVGTHGDAAVSIDEASGRLRGIRVVQDLGDAPNLPEGLSAKALSVERVWTSTDKAKSTAVPAIPSEGRDTAMSLTDLLDRLDPVTHRAPPDRKVP